jgi:hypothetical protein
VPSVPLDCRANAHRVRALLDESCIVTVQDAFIAEDAADASPHDLSSQRAFPMALVDELLERLQPFRLLVKLPCIHGTKHDSQTEFARWQRTE